MIKVIKKYRLFLSYVITAGFSFILDLALFKVFFLTSNLLFKELSSIFVATLFARAFSSFINYYLNKNVVFKSNKAKSIDKESLLKYVLLVIINLGLSALFVSVLHIFIKIDPTLIKIPVDILLFISNFFIQKYFIFKGDIKHEK